MGDNGGDVAPTDGACVLCLQINPSVILVTVVSVWDTMMTWVTATPR